MRYILSFILLLFLFNDSAHSQIYRDPYEGAALSGSIRERGTYIPVAWARIRVKGTKVDTTANARGFFVVNGVGGKTGGVPLIITHDDYETIEVPALIGGMEEMGVIFMDRKRRDINPVTVNDVRYSGSEVSTETFSEPGTQAVIFDDDNPMLWANRYSLGMLGFRPRGYDWQNTDVHFNGINVNDPSTGYASPMLWNGFSDLILSRAKGSLGIMDYMSPYFGGVTGTSDITIRPSQFREQSKVTYGYANSLFTHQVGATYASGAMDNDWSIVASVAGRTGEGFADGMKYENLSYFLSAEYLLTPYQHLWFTVMGAPTKRNMQSFSTQEVYDSIDNNYYNSAWGKYNGEDRSARQHRNHQPIATINHLWEVNDYTNLRTSLGVSYATTSNTNLAWTSGVENPWPDADFKLSTLFQDVEKQQFNWDTLYSTNLTALDTNNLYQAKYHLGKQYKNAITASFSSVYDTYVWENLTATAGVNGKYYRGSFYNKMDDLLGADYWLNVDKFTVEDAATIPPSFYQNDVNNPNKEIKDGDKFGYDYNINQYSFDAWTRWTLGWRRWSFTGAALAGYTHFSHKSNVQNGKFVTDNLGETSKGFANLAAKANAMYPLSRLAYVEVSGLFQMRPAQFRDAYLAPELSGELVPNLKAEKIISADASFVRASGFLDIKLTGFYTMFNDQTRTRVRYMDDIQSSYSLSLSGLNQTHFGGELSTNVRLFRGLSLKGAFTYGIYKYSSDPLAIYYQHNTAARIDELPVSMNKLYVPNVPQVAGTGGILYDSPLRFWLGGNVSYAGKSYAEVNPLRYAILPVVEVVEGGEGEPGPEQVAEYEPQAELASGISFDLYGGYVFQFGKHYISLNVNVQNLLDNQKIQIGGYERWGRYNAQASVVTPSYLYAYGRTLSFMLSYRF